MPALTLFTTFVAGVNSVIIIVVVLAALTVAVMAAVGVVFFCKHSSKKVEFSGGW